MPGHGEYTGLCFGALTSLRGDDVTAVNHYELVCVSAITRLVVEIELQNKMIIIDKILYVLPDSMQSSTVCTQTEQ